MLSRRLVLAGLAAVPLLSPENPAQGQTAWEERSPMPVPRSEMPATTLDGQIYVAGGFGADTAAHVYDPEADEWAELPELPVGTNHPGITSWNGRVLLAGGYSRDGADAHDGIWMLEPGETSWEQIGALPHRMGAFGFAAIDSEVFVIGGALEFLNGHPSDECWRWDPEEDRWTEAAPLPRMREHLACTGHEGKIYVAGGRVHGQASPELGEALDIYDPATDAWTAGAPLPAPRSGLNGASSCAGIVVAGGETPTEVFADVDLYDPVNDTWSVLPSLPVAVHGVAVTTIENDVYTLGGSTEAGTIANTSAVWRLPMLCVEE